MQVTKFLTDLKKLKKQDLLEIKGIGEVLADSFLEFLNSSRYDKLLNDFQKLEKENQGLELDITNFEEKPKTKLSNKRFVITGSFNKSRNEIKKELESLGATAVSSVSSQTDFLLAGEKAGSKLTKAKKLGIRIFTSSQELNQEFEVKLDF